MMEPWQEGRPEPGEWLGTRFVCRVSGAPADGVDGLRATRTLEQLDRLLAAERELHAKREELSAVLFAAIGAAGDDRPLRNKLITLKRELYNLRPAAAAKVDEAAARLDPAHAGTLRAFAALLEERAALDAALREAYAAETPELRRRFLALLDDADFHKGLMISSRSLYTALGRYGEAARAAGAELSGKEEKTERGLLRYYTRMAMKATPFSTFCAIIPGEFVDDGASGGDGDGAVRFVGDPRRKRSFVRVNKFIYGLLFDHLKTRPAVRHALRVEPNPTLREQEGRLVFLTAIESREVFQRLANNEVLELIAASFKAGDRPTLGELIDALTRDPQIEATPEEAEAYLDKLIEIGFLRFHTGIREQDADWDLPFRELLDAIDDDHARQSSALLAELRGVVERYTDAEVGERARMIEEMHTLLTSAIDAMEIQQRLRRDMPFYEDATSPARAEVALTPAVRRTFDRWADWTRLTSRVAWPRGEQATMRRFFDDYYAGRGSIPLLVFYEDFYREHFKAHVEKEAKARAGVHDEELKKYNVGNPFELEFVKRLGTARDEVGEVVRRKWHEAPDAEEIALTADEVEAALRGVENTSGVCRSMGSFACLAPPPEPGGDPRLVLQGGSYTAGFGKYFSRFLYMLPDDVQEQVRRENAALTDDLLAEICGDAQFNANLHPPLLKWEISYPTGESGAAEEQLRSSEIAVEPDPEDPDTLRLVHAPTGRRVVPVDLGFLNPRMRPPLYQLVSRFTPPAMFGPPIPESPEPRRPRPAPPEEPADTAVAADTAAEGDAAADTAVAAPVEGDAPADTAVASPAEGEPPAVPAPAADGAPAEAPPAPPPPRIVVRPRVTFGESLVLARRRWLVPGPLFPQREPHEPAADFFVRANRWRIEAGIPETSYVRINPLPEPPTPKPGDAAGAQAAADAAAEAQAAGEVPGYEAPAPEQADEEHDEAAAAEEGAGGEAAEGAEGEGAEGAAKTPPKPRTPGSRDLHKPQFID
ncbi:MAG TPA: lantibiotic dehydratase, partial [Longimicrobium sp.]|nr:lantibiotic dehydratase [Longimicrobium sp.]